MNPEVVQDEITNDGFDFTVEASESSPVEVVETIDDVVINAGLFARCN